MKESLIGYFLVLVVSVAAPLMLSPNDGMADDDQMKIPPARKIPGLTAEDKFPNGCVDCHINMPDIKKDERISTLMSRWDKKIEPKLLKKAQDVSPGRVTIKGTHPQSRASLKNIPAACITCHSNMSRTAPPFAAMIHAIHLTGGEDNHFLTIFQGECTYCHKLNAATGVWIMPSSSEK
jgi:hypothetical protein